MGTPYQGVSEHVNKDFSIFIADTAAIRKVLESALNDELPRFSDKIMNKVKWVLAVAGISTMFILIMLLGLLIQGGRGSSARNDH